MYVKSEIQNSPIPSAPEMRARKAASLTSMRFVLSTEVLLKFSLLHR